jgi:hypothetical protein
MALIRFRSIRNTIAGLNCSSSTKDALSRASRLISTAFSRNRRRSQSFQHIGQAQCVHRPEHVYIPGEQPLNAGSALQPHPFCDLIQSETGTLTQQHQLFAHRTHGDLIAQRGYVFIVDVRTSTTYNRRMEAHRKIIDRFGGIREMARKLDHANHTTVQGWHERSKIPVERWAEVQAAAEKHNIPFSISELLPEAA